MGHMHHPIRRHHKMSTQLFRRSTLAMHKELGLQYHNNFNQTQMRMVLWISLVYPTLSKSFTGPKTA